MTSLAIHANASFLPALRSATEFAAAAGADTTDYSGWPTIPVAGDEDHPSTMNATALQEALQRAGVGADELSLVVSGGISRDYAPSWSIATEAMRLSGADDQCIGVDLTSGCLGGLLALDFANGWLRSRGGGYAAIICSERWTWTVERGDPTSRPFWGIGDGAAASIVGVGTDRLALAEFVGVEYCSVSDLNAQVLIRYGGTRNPSAPPGAHPHQRSVSDRNSKDVRKLYHKGYASAMDRARARFDLVPEQLVCNQITPSLVDEIAALAGVDAGSVVRTGELFGHIGSADLQIGVERLLRPGPLRAPAMIAASTPYAFGAGMLVPPARNR
jgi:3-oxoacyl-[acyl-carrier-protein] synthase III